MRRAESRKDDPARSDHAYARSRFGLGLFSTALLFAAGSGFAQNTLEEVVVTAQKRETTLQAVPFSVAAASDEQIRNSGAANIVDLARNIASVTIADLGPGQSQIAVRGISSGQVIRDQPGVKEQVGVYLDESPISVALFTPDLELADLARFEVLRGPQGTLFGAGSEAGTLRYITRQPVLGEYQELCRGYCARRAGRRLRRQRARRCEYPARGDHCAQDVVGYYNKLPGFIDAIQPGGGVKKRM